MESVLFHCYQQQLIEHLQTHYSFSERVLKAFATIPRHPFIPHYYLHQRGERSWTRYAREETETWYQQIYQNEALVTQVDKYGRTLSSSSQPSMMAMMLDALDIQPGMRVLEIGTGTGYNAALLSALTEDPHLVTTIDIDVQTTQQARQALQEVGCEGVTVIEGDGSQGYATHVPYDRMIATASTPTLPQAWIEQLAPHGILVAILQPSYAPLGGMLKAEKHEDKLQGSLLKTASFMVLREEKYQKRTIQIDFDAPLITSFPYAQALFQPDLLRENPHFAFFLYSQIPDLYVFQKPKAGETFFYRETAPQGYIIFRQDSSSIVELRGEPFAAYRLWTELLRVYSFWLHCGEPGITQYQFEYSQGLQILFLTTLSGIIWPFVAGSP